MLRVLSLKQAQGGREGGTVPSEGEGEFIALDRGEGVVMDLAEGFQMLLFTLIMLQKTDMLMK